MLQASDCLTRVLDAPRHLDPSLILEEFRCRGRNCNSTPKRTCDLGIPSETGDPWWPHPVGHFHDETGKHLPHSESGPACAITGRPDPLKGYGGTLLLVDGGRA